MNWNEIISALIKGDPRIIAALITAIFSALVSIMNIIVNVYQNRQTRKHQEEQLSLQKSNFEQTLRSENEKIENQLKSEIEINNKNLSIQYITNKRLEWMHSVRIAISDFVTAVISIISRGENEPWIKDDLLAINKKACEIRLLLNFSDEFDFEILSLINAVVINQEDFRKKEVVLQQLVIITDLMQIYLKNEWERIKYEVKSQEYSKEDQRKAICTMLAKRISIITNEDEIIYLKEVLQKLSNE